LAISIDGETKTLKVSHYGEGFVGVFRTSEDVESLYPAQRVLTAIEKRLPFGVDQEGKPVAVEENDILFCVLPHKLNWRMKPVDLQGAMYGNDPSDRKAFGQWAQKMILMLRDSRASILLASIGRKHPVHRPQSFNVMYSENYRNAFKKVRNPDADNSTDDDGSREEVVYSGSDDDDDDDDEVILFGFRESAPSYIPFRGSESPFSSSSSSGSSDDYGDAMARLFGDEPPQRAPAIVADSPPRPSAYVINAFLRQWNLDADDAPSSDDSDEAGEDEEGQRGDNQVPDCYLNGDGEVAPPPPAAERRVVPSRAARKSPAAASEVAVVTPLGGYSHQAAMLAANGCTLVLFVVSLYAFLLVYMQLNSIQAVYINIY
jgi:hypothetical protein